MTKWKLHEELRGKTWENYSIEIVNDYEKML
jgi:plasmid maintenance system killer protein